MIQILALSRIFVYLLVIIVSIYFLRQTSRRSLLAGNIILAFALMTNAIESIVLGRHMASTQVFSTINVAVLIWAIAHVMEFFGKGRQ